MDYELYDIDDFVTDQKFRNWVLSPDPELTHFWDQWQMANPQRKAVIDQARALVIATSPMIPSLSQEHKDRLWQRIQREKGLKKKDDDPSYTTRALHMDNMHIRGSENGFKLAMVVKIAAGILLIAMVAGLAYFQVRQPGSVREDQEMIVKSNPSGQKSRIFLPDGSVVNLNAASTIKYPSSFALHERKVSLIGEAFFEVVSDSRRPFIVTSDRLVTKAVGTSFNINNFDDGRTVVALVSGIVEVSSLDGEVDGAVRLRPGELAEYRRGIQTMTRSTFDTEDIIAWKDGIMIFKDTPVMEVFEKLENWYGVDIQVSGLTDESLFITTTFDNVSLDNALNNLGFSWDFKHEKEDKRIFITFN